MQATGAEKSRCRSLGSEKSLYCSFGGGLTLRVGLRHRSGLSENIPA